MLLVVSYTPSVFTFTLENNTKGITIDRHMEFSIFIWSTIIIYERNSDENFWWRKNVDCHRGPSVALYIITCHFEAYAKAIYPDRNIVLSFWRRGNVGRHCGLSLMVTVSWLVVIVYIIFLMRRVLIWYIAIEVKDWWFDMGYNPPYY